MALWMRVSPWGSFPINFSQTCKICHPELQLLWSIVDSFLYLTLCDCSPSCFDPVYILLPYLWLGISWIGCISADKHFPHQEQAAASLTPAASSRRGTTNTQCSNHYKTFSQDTQGRNHTTTGPGGGGVGHSKERTRGTQRRRHTGLKPAGGGGGRTRSQPMKIQGTPDRNHIRPGPGWGGGAQQGNTAPPRRTTQGRNAREGKEGQPNGTKGLEPLATG